MACRLARSRAGLRVRLLGKANDLAFGETLTMCLEVVGVRYTQGSTHR